MTLNELKYLVAVARERHFGRAARACHISQPTLSVAIRKLEEELGVTLFERSRAEVTPTQVGEQIVEQAQQVLEQVERIRLTARQGSDPLVGSLRVGAIYTIGPYVFPQLVPVIHDRAPAMPLIIEENYTARLAERLKQGEVDAILVSLPFREQGIVTLPLYREPFVVVMPVSHPWNQKPAIEPAMLEEERMLLLGAGHCFRDQVLELCPNCAKTVDTLDGSLQTVEGGSLETVRLMVASGLGVTVLPVTAAGADRYSQRLLTIRRFVEPEPYRTVALAWRASFPRPRAMDVLVAALRECALSGVEWLAKMPNENI